MLKLIKICDFGPEQYIIYDEKGEQIGYCRLNYGHFYARCTASNTIVYETDTIGEWALDDSERVRHLNAACRHLLAELSEETGTPIYTIG
jgi:hypothetical protein